MKCIQVRLTLRIVKIHLEVEKRRRIFLVRLIGERLYVPRLLLRLEKLSEDCRRFVVKERKQRKGMRESVLLQLLSSSHPPSAALPSIENHHIRALSISCAYRRNSPSSSSGLAFPATTPIRRGPITSVSQPEFISSFSLLI